MSQLVLDTSALLMWTLAPERLTKPAARAIAKAKPIGLLASAISLWEIGLKVQQKKLMLGLEFAEYVRRLELVAELTLLPVDVRTWLHTLELDWSHRDPADRVIVATADLRGVPLVTSDVTIGKFYPETIW